MWRQTTRQEANRMIFQEELDAFLPEEVLDFHVHLFGPGVVPAGQTFSCAGHGITQYTLEDLRRDYAEALPRRNISAVCFGLPAPSMTAGPTTSTSRVCDGRRFFPLRLFDPRQDTAEAVRAELAEGGFRGIKPYPDYAGVADVRDAQIDLMLPDWVMRIIDELGLLVMLHIPRPGRLADPLNQQQLVRLCRTYPKATIVLAHVGRAYYLKNIVGHLADLVGLPNLYFDLTMVSNWEVLEYLFQSADAGRIVFGSDSPLAFAPGASVEINDQYSYVTPVPWELSICDSAGKLRFTSFLYEQLAPSARPSAGWACRTSLSAGSSTTTA